MQLSKWRRKKRNGWTDASTVWNKASVSKCIMVRGLSQHLGSTKASGSAKQTAQSPTPKTKDLCFVPPEPARTRPYRRHSPDHGRVAAKRRQIDRGSGFKRELWDWAGDITGERKPVRRQTLTNVTDQTNLGLRNRKRKSNLGHCEQATWHYFTGIKNKIWPFVVQLGLD